IEEPVRGASQGDSIAYRVRTVVFDRANVRRLHLRAAPSVDESQASDSACVLVRAADMAAKGDVAEFSVDDLRHSGASKAAPASWRFADANVRPRKWAAARYV